MSTGESSQHTARELDFEREVLPHLADVLRYARFLARDHGDADDLVQETYLCAFKSWTTFQPGTDARRWLFTICRNLFVRSVRREQRVVHFHDEPELDAIASARLHIAAKQNGYEDLFHKVDLGPAIDRAVADLPETQRTVVAMIDLEGLSYAEVASALEVPIGTVRSRLFRGRRVLQQTLIEFARDAGLVAPVNDPPVLAPFAKGGKL